MYINLNNKDIEIVSRGSYGDEILFRYKGKKYYFKLVSNLDNFYNELIACRIAKQMNIPCCEYYPAEYNGFVGVASEYYEDDKVISMEEYLMKKFGNKIRTRNNILDLSNCFSVDFDEETANRLIKELIDIFIFDAIIGNADRNSTNYKIVIDGSNTHFAPLYDNENMLDEHAIYYGDYSLGLDEHDYYDGEKFNILYKFLNWVDDDTYERFKSSLELISIDNINRIFDDISKDTMIAETIKEKVIKKFQTNKKMILNYINSDKRKTYKLKHKKVCYN